MRRVLIIIILLGFLSASAFAQEPAGGTTMVTPNQGMPDAPVVEPEHHVPLSNDEGDMRQLPQLPQAPVMPEQPAMPAQPSR
jgi:hypothetical protein